MKNKLTLMMSVLVAIFFSCMLYLTPVYAKDVDIWADDHFNFKNVHTIALDGATFDVCVDDDVDDLTERKVNSINRTVAEKAGMRVISTEEVLPSSGLKFKINIEKWCSREEWHEPYTTTETRTATRKKKDSSGRWVEEKYNYEVPVQHPGYYTYWSTVQVRYDGYTADGQMVYSHREIRNREDARAHMGMYERITKDFMSRFSKYTKR